MSSTFSNRLRVELIGTGDKSGTWGVTNNTNLGTILEEAIAGVAAVSMPSDANYTLVANNGSSDEARRAVLSVTSVGSLTATRDIIVPTKEKVYLVYNNTTGAQSIRVKTAAGTGITIANGKKQMVYCDGTNVLDAITNVPGLITLSTGLTMSATDKLVGRDTAGAGASEEISVGGGLEFTGTAGIQRSALTGDVTATAGSNATTIAAGVVTYAKIQNVSTQYRILGRSSSGAGSTEEITSSANVFSILGAANYGAVRTLLNLVPGTDIQAYDAGLAALASFNTNGILVQTSDNNFAGRTLTAGANISITNGTGVSGNPTVALDSTAAMDISNTVRGRIALSSETGGALTSASANKKVKLATAPSIAQNVFTADDSIYLINNTSSSMTLTQTSGTQRKAGTTTTGNLTIPAYGMCVVDFTSATEWVVSGT